MKDKLKIKGAYVFFTFETKALSPIKVVSIFVRRSETGEFQLGMANCVSRSFIR
jgi:hypothetical protein